MALLRRAPSARQAVGQRERQPHLFGPRRSHTVRLTVTDKDGDFGQAIFQYVVCSMTRSADLSFGLSRAGMCPISPSSTFGPRAKASQSFRYSLAPWDRHPSHVLHTHPRDHKRRGERLAGDYTSYEDRVVQIRHYKPDRTSCSNDGCFYSNYMQMASVSVQVDHRWPPAR